MVTYDTNGSMLTGAGRTVTYTGFNMPATISGNGSTLSFVYDDTHQRVKQIAPSGTVYYVHPDNAGGLFYEKEVKTTGVTEHKHYINASSGPIAIYTTRSTSVTTLRYLHKDHLGSTNAISDESGTVVERLAYDAWGKRQFPNGTPDNGNTLVGINTDRGFTGHEHLEEVGLVHMNGRIYDPRIGRFMSADPLIQSPYNLQSYNRYTYGFNNPLNGVDPSGYGFFSSIFKAIKSVVKSVMKNDVGRIAVAAGVGYMTGYWYLTNFGTVAGTTAAGTIYTTGSYVASGMVGGFSSTFVTSGGNLEASLKSGLIGGGFGFAGGLPGDWVYAGHAAVGCVSGELQGGGCARGAVSSLVGKLVTVETRSWTNEYARFTAAVVASGTVSTISGGNFSNGALSSAFAYLFNEATRRYRSVLDRIADRAAGIPEEQGKTAAAEVAIKNAVTVTPGKLDSLADMAGTVAVACGATANLPCAGGALVVGGVSKGYSWLMQPPSVATAAYDTVTTVVQEALPKTFFIQAGSSLVIKGAQPWVEPVLAERLSPQ